MPPCLRQDAARALLGNANLLTLKNEVRILDDFPIRFKDFRMRVCVTVVLLGNSRQRVALANDVVRDRVLRGRRILDRQQANFEQNREFIASLRNPFGPRATPDLFPGLFRNGD